MDYNFREIEKKWQKRWVENGTYRVVEDKNKKKFYVLNMFPYPSGAGLHVGHPLGYIASDIYARYKRQQGFNVLNPMGYDAYGLPAEQYAIQTGQHPEKTTFENINRYRSQLDKIGFSFDWEREVRTCDPIYYKWTQWAFQRMFKSYFSTSSQKAQPTIKLIEHFELMGTENCNALGTEELHFTASDWHNFSEKKKQEVLMNYRIAYLADTMVNWCPKLGTVLANDEVVDGVSVRGGYPVVQKKMRQWCLRVSAYAQRLLDGLEEIDWTDSLKETQRNWIGRSEGTEVEFKIAPPSAPEGATNAGKPNTQGNEAPSGAVGGALIIDCFGLLSSIYRYATVCYVGGGFGVSIHNTVEAAVWGKPVIFGPENQKFQEAQELKACGGGLEIKDYDDFARIMDRLSADTDALQKAGRAAGDYVMGKAGAVEKILASVKL